MFQNVVNILNNIDKIDFEVLAKRCNVERLYISQVKFISSKGDKILIDINLNSELIVKIISPFLNDKYEIDTIKINFIKDCWDELVVSYTYPNTHILKFSRTYGKDADPILVGLITGLSNTSLPMLK